MGQKPTFAERWQRINQAVSLERPDRVPVVLEYGAFAARVTNTPLPEFLLNLRRSVEVMIDDGYRPDAFPREQVVPGARPAIDQDRRGALPKLDMID